MRFFLIFLSTCGILHAVNSRQVVVTVDDITGYGDFDADGDLDALVVQRATGLYRAAFQLPDGSLQWAPARPCGLPSVDALTCGPIRVAGKDAVVLSGKQANQMVLIEPTLSAAASSTEQLIPSGLGPGTVTALDLPLPGNDPALMDLVVHTSENNSPNEDQRHLFQSLSNTTTESLTLNLSVVAERGSRFRNTDSGPDKYAALLRGPNERLRIFRTTTTSLPIQQTLIVRPGSEFLSGSFDGSALNHLLIYVPGDPLLQVSRSNGSSLSVKVPHTLEEPIAAIFPVGPHHFFVLFQGQTQGRFYQLSAQGVPLPGQKLSASLDHRITGVMGFDNQKLSLLTGPITGGAATTSLDFNFNGSKWEQIGSTPLPASGNQVSLTNTLLYDGEPLVNPTAKLIETIQIPDWTSGLTITAGGNVVLTPEAFSTESGGLSAGSSISFPPQSSPTHLFGNQSEDAVSLLSLQTFVGLLPPQVTVTPPSGKYTTHISPVLISPDATTSLFYRFAGETSWQVATAGLPVSAPGDTLSPFTLQYYATSSTGGRSPIYEADYSYFGEPGDLDSDGDGVPDFVEIANGLDPQGGKDEDLDAVDDLYELLLDTDPLDEGSVPPTPLSLNLQNSFDLAVTPVSLTALNTPGRPYPEGASEPPADLYLHSLDGTLLGHEVTRVVSGFPQPTALFENVPASDRDLFVVVSTSPTFPIQPVVNSAFGRELVGLVPVPYQSVGEFAFEYDGVSSTADAAADWLAAAQDHYLGFTRPLVAEVLTPDDSLALLLTERLFREYLRRRDATLPNSPLSLTAFRDPVAPQVASEAIVGQPFFVEVDELLALQNRQSAAVPGHLLQSVYENVLKKMNANPTGEMVAMKKLSAQIAYFSDFVSPGNAAGLYPNPFDTLRAVITQLSSQANAVDGQIALPGFENGVGYSRSVTLSASELADADALLVQLLSDIPSRPTTSLLLTVGADSFREGHVPLLFTSGGLPYELYRNDGTPYLFQEALPVGAELQVVAYTDRDHLPSQWGTPLDVLSAELVAVPQPEFVDSNFNALDDEWELFFFGQLADPFTDFDGDGYSNLQELLEETNPTLASSFPTTQAIPLSPPLVKISHSSEGGLELETEFPSFYREDIRFSLLTQSDLTLPFQPVPGIEASDIGSDTYQLQLPLPPESKQFFRFRIELIQATTQ